MKIPLLLLGMLATAKSAIVTLDTQHIDLSINFNSTLVGTATNPWLLGVRNEDARIEYAGVRQATADPQRAELLVPELAAIEVPDDSRYLFLGTAGTTVWILPQTQDPNLLYAGVSTENKTTQSGWTGVGVDSQFLVRGIASSVFKSNQVTLSLASFSGPGAFYLYSTDAFGNPQVVFNTADGLSSGDSRVFSPAIHSHFNWAFTTPGDYHIGLRASGTLNAGNLVTQSDVTTMHFRVVPEPGTGLLAIAGLAALCKRRRRRAP